MVAMRDSSGMALAVERFAGWEPLGFEAGDNNWYRFVANGPTERTDPSGLATVEGATWTTPTNPDIGDVIANYHNLGTFPCGFRLSLQFQFPNRIGGNMVKPEKYTKAPRVSFFGNSGVYIYNAIEIQIIDQNRIDALGDAALDPNNPRNIVYRGYQSEAANTLVTGIPYGFGEVPLVNGRPKNNLKPTQEWNTLKITFTPHYGINDTAGRPERLVSADIEVILNDLPAFKGRSPRGLDKRKTHLFQWYMTVMCTSRPTTAASSHSGISQSIRLCVEVSFGLEDS